MRVLLRHIRSGLYYAGRQRWVRKPDSARDFRDVRRATKILHRARLAGAEVALAFENTGLRSRFAASHAH